MKAFFKSQSALADELAAIKSELTLANEAGEQLVELVSTLKASVDSKQVALDEANATLASTQTKLEETEASLESVSEQLTAAKEEATANANSAHSEAIQLVASAGHSEPVAIKDENDVSSDQLYAKYRELKATNPKAATKFWNDHKEDLVEK